MQAAGVFRKEKTLFGFSKVHVSKQSTGGAFMRSKRQPGVVSTLVLAALLGGCGGGGGTSSGGSTGTGLSGTAANGIAIPNSKVALQTANGDTRDVGTTDAQGRFSGVTLPDSTSFPVILSVTLPNGNDVLRSIIPSLKNTVATANINPITHAITAQVLPTGTALSNLDVSSGANGFDQRAKALVQTAFGDTVDYSTFADKPFQARTIDNPKGGGLADTLIDTIAAMEPFRKPSDIFVSATDANDPSVSKNLLTNPAFQARLSGELIAQGRQASDVKTLIQSEAVGGGDTTAILTNTTAFATSFQDVFTGASNVLIGTDAQKQAILGPIIQSASLTVAKIMDKKGVTDGDALTNTFNNSMTLIKGPLVAIGTANQGQGGTNLNLIMSVTGNQVADLIYTSPVDLTSSKPNVAALGAQVKNFGEIVFSAASDSLNSGKDKSNLDDKGKLLIVANVGKGVSSSLTAYMSDLSVDPSAMSPAQKSSLTKATNTAKNVASTLESALTRISANAGTVSLNSEVLNSMAQAIVNQASDTLKNYDLTVDATTFSNTASKVLTNMASLVASNAVTLFANTGTLDSNKQAILTGAMAQQLLKEVKGLDLTGDAPPATALNVATNMAQTMGPALVAQVGQTSSYLGSNLQVLASSAVASATAELKKTMSLETTVDPTVLGALQRNATETVTTSRTYMENLFKTFTDQGIPLANVTANLAVNNLDGSAMGAVLTLVRSAITSGGDAMKSVAGDVASVAATAAKAVLSKGGSLAQAGNSTVSSLAAIIEIAKGQTGQNSAQIAAAINSSANTIKKATEVMSASTNMSLENMVASIPNVAAIAGAQVNVDASNLLLNSISGNISLGAELTLNVLASQVATADSTILTRATAQQAAIQGSALTLQLTTTLSGADGPVLASPIADQLWTGSGVKNYQIPANTFSGFTGNTPTYTLSSTDGSALPSWLLFDPTTRTISGNPPSGIASLSLRVKADNGATQIVSNDFILNITSANDLPLISDFKFETNKNTGTVQFKLSDTDSDPGKLFVSLNNSNLALIPSGNVVISGSVSDRKITFTPATNQYGNADLAILVSDGTDTIENKVSVAVDKIPEISAGVATYWDQSEWFASRWSGTQVVSEQTGVTLGVNKQFSSGTKFSWEQVSGPVVTLSDSTALHPTFISPKVVPNDLLSFQVTASNNSGAVIGTDTIYVSVFPNDAFSANSSIWDTSGWFSGRWGGDLIVAELDSVTLKAKKNFGDGTNFSWKQIGGPPVTLDNPNSSSPKFISSSVSPVEQLKFILTVTNSDGSKVAYDVYVSVYMADRTQIVRILNVNDPPLALAGSLVIDENKSGSLVLAASDADGDPLTYSVVKNGKNGTAVIANASSGLVTYTPSPNFHGSDSFTFKVNDGKADSNEATVAITVNSVNDRPKITFNGFTIVPKTGQLTTYKKGDDGDLQDGVDWPSNVFSDNGDGTVTDNRSGLVWLKKLDCFHSKDGLGLANAISKVTDLNNGLISCSGYSGKFSDWRMANRNELRSLIDYGNKQPALPLGHPFSLGDAIFSSSTTAGIDASKLWNISLLSGEISLGGPNQVHLFAAVRGKGKIPKTGQTVSYVPQDDGDLQAGLDWPVNRFIDQGNAVILDSMTGLEWYKNANCWSASDWSSAIDKVGKANAGTETCTVQNIIFNDWRLPNVNELLSLSDASVPFLPKGHLFSDVQSGYWTSTSYDATSAYFLQMSDGSTSILQKNVTSGSILLVRNGSKVTVAENGESHVVLSGTDTDGDSLKYSITSLPLHGKVAGTAPKVTYTPDANWSGTDHFSYKVNDGTVDSDSGSVDILVYQVNHTPKANNGSLVTMEDISSNGSLNAVDTDGNSLTYSIVTNGSKGTATITNATSGSYLYTPNANVNGSDTFTYKVNDGTVDSNTATVTVTITPTNDAPTVATTIPDQTWNGSGAKTFQVPVGTFADADGDTLTYTATKGDGTALPSWLTFDPTTRTFSGNPPNGATTISLKVTASDGNAGTVSSTFNLAFSGSTNDAPTVATTIPDQTWNGSGAKTFQVPVGT
ncbi:MAG: tandem-95 repeat protein, partial [Magnetococcales bacterium]|nr:tandem-95 repeat protein [Magnetococcales bacterium]